MAPGDKRTRSRVKSRVTEFLVNPKDIIIGTSRGNVTSNTNDTILCSYDKHDDKVRLKELTIHGITIVNPSTDYYNEPFKVTVNEDNNMIHIEPKYRVKGGKARTTKKSKRSKRKSQKNH
jgi:hypothetical protein